jgi:hypothetical protein
MEPVVAYALSMAVLTLLVLILFINIVCYFISLYLANNYFHLELKSLFITRYIKFFNKTNIKFLIFKIILAFFVLIVMILWNLYLFNIVSG